MKSESRPVTMPLTSRVILRKPSSLRAHRLLRTRAPQGGFIPELNGGTVRESERRLLQPPRCLL
ncbi:MAG TPA: hypothetical protein PLT00_06880 [Verrucomicrobiota bacterium]|nr:hypothetical protein [Verrucomicrobiota bacterium]HPY30201.1 hypothetical protein [Verrucomicrobiota bacterium]HQB16421.1 hypothetical protein [Verrucomicrobiota bacterium]